MSAGLEKGKGKRYEKMGKSVPLSSLTIPNLLFSVLWQSEMPPKKWQARRVNQYINSHIKFVLQAWLILFSDHCRCCRCKKCTRQDKTIKLKPCRNLVEAQTSSDVRLIQQFGSSVPLPHAYDESWSWVMGPCLTQSLSHPESTPPASTGRSTI